MKASNKLLKLVKKALSESVDFRSMYHLARELIPNYDINQRLNLPENISATRLEAASQIVNDMESRNMLINFLNILLGIQFKGYKGRTYRISGINELMDELYNIGFMYDPETGMLMDNPNVRKSRNWGSLMEGAEYFLSFLWVDIIGYSRMVKQYKGELIQKTYNEFMTIVRNIIEGRNGRIWNIAGDGLLCAFHFSNKCQMALLCAIEILHKIFLYNRIRIKLDKPLKLRLTVHSGMCIFSEDPENTSKCDIVQQTIELEKKSNMADTVIISKNTEGMLEPALSKILMPAGAKGAPEYFTYRLEWVK